MHTLPAGTALPLSHFSLPLTDGSTHSFNVQPETSGVFIFGQAGTGKSVLALALADQQLKCSEQAHLHIVSGHPPLRPGFDIPYDWMAVHMAKDLISKYQNRAAQHYLPQHATPEELSELPGAESPPGSIVIVDEPWPAVESNSEFILNAWLEAAAERQHILIMTGQLLEEHFKEKLPDRIGTVLAGHSYKLVEEGDSFYDFVNRQQHLEYKYGDFSDFAVFTNEGPQFLGIARVPCPGSAKAKACKSGELSEDSNHEDDGEQFPDISNDFAARPQGFLGWFRRR